MIFVNQAGYLPKESKKASSLAAGRFQVIDKNSGKTAYEGEAVYLGLDETSEDEVYCMDFTALTETGAYYLQSETGEASAVFAIGEQVYQGLKNDMIKALYFQRCGCALKTEYAGIYAHPSCHTAPAVFYSDRSRKQDMTGGWHDAGDYGRYATAAAVAAAHLLYAYELFPESFEDSLNIPESGNGVPDLLNECRYELEWLLKMQNGEGGVYHKLTSERHANFVMPQEDGLQFLIFPVSSMATADFAAVMSLASRSYEAYDRVFAERTRQAAEKAWVWLLAHPEFQGFDNPAGCNTGPYDAVSDRDERLWAAAEMARMTGRPDAKAVLEALCGPAVSKTSMGWQDVSGLAGLAVLFDPANREEDSDNRAKDSVRTAFRETFLAEADRLVQKAGACGYGAAMGKEDYCWGSNMVVTNRGILLVAAALLTGKKEYEETALAQLHYLLGRNALGRSYVTGHGENAFCNPHNRPTVAAGVPVMPGWVSGGPNAEPCDEKAEWLVKRGTPPMKCYLDLWECYSLNEITIYWNSSAVFLAGYFCR